MLSYISSYFIGIFFILFFSNFISFKRFDKSSITHTFFSVIISITILTSLFAVFYTKGKSIYWSYILIFLILYYKKEIYFKKFELLNFRIKFKLIVWSIPILLSQYFLNFNFRSFLPYIPSDDILIYASYSKHLVDFGQENKFALFSQFYPSLFTGMNPYHFFEIWMNSAISVSNNLSYSHNIVFVTYPTLIWVLLLGLFSIGEQFTQITFLKKIYISLLLFIGPIYFNIYEIIFNDGNFINSSVFTIPGFVKQTLSYSYYGQKHLPVYIFSIIFILLLINNLRNAAILSCQGIISASFGVFPGIYAGISFLSLKDLRSNYKFTIIFFISSFLLFFGIISLFGIGVSDEISQSTFYLNYFLKDLNWKGEVIRIIQKLIFPLLWFLILYFPILLALIINKNILKNFPNLKAILGFSFFTYLGGVCFTLIVDGLNTDQFITNLLPFYNVVFTTLIIYIATKIDFQSIQSKFFFLVISLIVAQNIYFILEFNKNFRRTFNDLYSQQAQNQLTKELKIDNPKFIAYLLTENTVSSYHPMHQCLFYPAKFLYINNFLNHLNINYPYYTYPKSSTSHAYAPYNQMKYYLKGQYRDKTKFQNDQVGFLKKHNINWLLCQKNVTLPKDLTKFVVLKINDSISGENYYKLKLNNRINN
jgi:hypothetical protein